MSKQVERTPRLLRRRAAAAITTAWVRVSAFYGAERPLPIPPRVSVSTAPNSRYDPSRHATGLGFDGTEQPRSGRPSREVSASTAPSDRYDLAPSFGFRRHRTAVAASDRSSSVVAPDVVSVSTAPDGRYDLGGSSSCTRRCLGFDGTGQPLHDADDHLPSRLRRHRAADTSTQ